MGTVVNLERGQLYPETMLGELRRQATFTEKKEGKWITDEQFTAIRGHKIKTL